MKDSTPRTIFFALLLVLVGGCGSGGNAAQEGSGGGFSSFRCNTISEGDASTVAIVDAGCANCTVVDEHNVADSSIQTFATLDATNSQQGQGVSIRSTAQSGVVYSSGRRVGAFVRYAEGATEGVNAEAVITIRTYISDTLQQEQSNGSASCTANCFLNRQDLGIGGDETQPTALMRFTATEIFDAVEIHYSAPGVHSGEADLKVYGLCSDAGVGR